MRKQGTHACGGDLGFRSDSSALAIVRRHEENYELEHLLELIPRPGFPLSPSQVCAAFADVMRGFGITRIELDSHYSESAREHFSARGISIRVTAPTQDAKVSSYITVRSLLAERRLRLIDNPRLLAQLKAIQSRPLAGGGISISASRKAGLGHGDLVSALVLAVGAAAHPPPFRGMVTTFFPSH